MTTDDGVRLGYTFSGRGSPLVLCHGGPGMWDYLAPVAEMLEDLVTIVRFDQRGSGRSPSAGPYTADRFITDLDCVRAHLGVERWIVGGHSWGATLALLYACAFPHHTQAIVYLDGTGCGRAWNPAYHEEADRRRSGAQHARLAELAANAARTAAEEREWRLLSWLPDFAPSEHALEFATGFAADPRPLNRDVNRQLNDEMRAWREDELLAKVATLDVPALIVHGSADPRPHWAIDSLADALPSAEVHKLEGIGHFPWLEDPNRFRAILRTFLPEVC